MTEWKECKLGEIATFKYGTMPKKDKILEKGGFPIYSGYRIVGLYSEYNLENPELIIVARGVGGTGDVKISPEKCFLTNLSIVVFLDESKLLKKFAYYYFTLNNLRYLDSGSAQSQITISDLSKVNISLPPLEIQKKIVAILSSLDDKIELNNKINVNLEQQAQALFKKLFEKQIEKLTVENSKPLSELIDIIDNRGKTPPTSTERNCFPILDVGALNSNGRIIDYKNCTKFVDEKTFNTFFRDGHPEENDILLSTVGSLAQIKFFKGNIGCIAQNVVAFRSKKLSSTYLYEYLKFIRNNLLAYNIGSVQPSIKVTHIIKYLIYIPTYNELSFFDSFSKSITEQIYNNVCENERLLSIRDTLLPKLMSGKIDANTISI